MKNLAVNPLGSGELRTNKKDMAPYLKAFQDRVAIFHSISNKKVKRICLGHLRTIKIKKGLCVAL